MRQGIEESYVSPEVTEYGSVESLTLGNNKCGTKTDQESAGTPLTGSITSSSC